MPDPATRLSGRRVLVTGATGGIGSAVSRALASAGARLAVTGRSASRLDALAAELELQTEVVGRTANIDDEAAIEALFSASVAAFGGLDALVNLSGGSLPGPIADTDVESYHRVIDANLTGTFITCKHFLRSTDPNDNPIIVNVSSMAGKRANATSPLYCTAKAAVDMLSRSLALQAKAQNVRVSTINPGGADTGFWGDRPIDRSTLLTADDVAEVIVFTLSRPPHVAVHDISFESSGLARGR